MVSQTEEVFEWFHARAVQQCLEKRTVKGKDPTGKLGGLVSRSNTVLAGCCWTNDLASHVSVFLATE